MELTLLEANISTVLAHKRANFTQNNYECGGEVDNKIVKYATSFSLLFFLNLQSVVVPNAIVDDQGGLQR
jgi:hypothetical protein